VEDAAAMLDVLARRAPGAEGSFLAAARRPPPRLRVRFTTNPPVGATAPEVAAAVRTVAARLAELGHEVDEVPPLSGSVEDFLPLYQRMAADAPVLREALLQPLTRWLRAEGRRRSAVEARAVRDALAARALAWCGDVDVVLTPTVPMLPPPVGAFADLRPEEAFGRAALLGTFTAMCNVSGQPALSLPVAAAGPLPAGAQLIGRVHGDATLLQLARQLEEALPRARPAAAAAAAP
jgi:amidase